MLTNPQSGITQTPIRVRMGLTTSIITKMKIMVHTAVITWLMLCWREVSMVSTSLVTRLNTSPKVFPSK